MYQHRTCGVFKQAAKFEVANNHIVKRNWHNNLRKLPYKHLPNVVPIDKLRIDEPVSGSMNWDDMSKMRKFEWDAKSLNARGFLRFQKEYKPAKDAKQRVLALSQSLVGDLQGKDIRAYEISDPKLKFQILNKAFEELDHSVPNSMLYLMKTVGDLVKFYQTPISTATPYDALVREKDELPPNLHVQKEPVRWSPDDPIFGGQTAFPKSSNIITGLRAKKKYKGYEAKKSWP